MAAMQRWPLVQLFADNSETKPFAVFAAPCSPSYIAQILGKGTEGASLRSRDDQTSLSMVGSASIPPGDYIFEKIKFIINTCLPKQSVQSLFPIIDAALKDLSISHADVSNDGHELCCGHYSVPSEAVIDEVLFDGCYLELFRISSMRPRVLSRPSSPPSSPLSTSGNIITLKSLNRRTLLTSSGSVYGAYGILPKDIWALLTFHYLSYGLLKKLMAVNGTISRLVRAGLEQRWKRVQKGVALPLEPLLFSKPSDECHALHFWPNGALAVVERDTYSYTSAFAEGPVFYLRTKSLSGSPASEVRIADTKGCSDLLILRSAPAETALSIFLTDDESSRVNLLSEKGKLIKTIGKGTGMDSPGAIVSDAKGEAIIVADTRNHRILILSRDGKVVRWFGKKGSADGEFLSPHGVALTRENLIVVSDTYNHRIQIFSFEGKFLRKFGSRGSETGQFNFPWGIDVDAENHIWIADFRNGRVQVLDASDGRVLSQIGHAVFRLPRSVKIREDGVVVILESNCLWVLK